MNVHLSDGRTVIVPLDVTKTYMEEVFGLKPDLDQMFKLSVIPRLLLGVDWTSVFAVYIPAMLDNRQLVASFVRAKLNVAQEEIDVMICEQSQAYDRPRLLIIEVNERPSKETMNLAASDLLKTGKIFLPLKGYPIASELFYWRMGQPFDFATVTIFPEDALGTGYVAEAGWTVLDKAAKFSKRPLTLPSENAGARLAIEVPLKS